MITTAFDYLDPSENYVHDVVLITSDLSIQYLKVVANEKLEIDEIGIWLTENREFDPEEDAIFFIDLDDPEQIDLHKSQI